MLAKRPFCFAWASPRDLKQTPPPQPASASLRVRSGDSLFVKKHCSVKFNKFYFKFDRKIPKQVLVVKFYRTIRHKILKFSASRVLP